MISVNLLCRRIKAVIISPADAVITSATSAENRGPQLIMVCMMRTGTSSREQLSQPHFKEGKPVAIALVWTKFAVSLWLFCVSCLLN